MTRLLVASCLVVMAAVACKDDERCERMRLDLSKTYGTLRESAVKRKLAGVDAAGWTAVEERAALLESSFMTRQVTWTSADKAKADLVAKLSGIQTDNAGNLTGYRLSVDAALKEHEAFSQQCR